MSYPGNVEATLIEINGHSCNSPSHQLDYVQNSNPPAYEAASTGDFASVKLEQETSGSTTTWKLTLLYFAPGNCGGSHTFTRSPAADDPKGDYCIDDAGTPDCSAGKAKVE